MCDLCRKSKAGGRKSIEDTETWSRKVESVTSRRGESPLAFFVDPQMWIPIMMEKKEEASLPRSVYRNGQPAQRPGQEASEKRIAQVANGFNSRLYNCD